MRAMIIYRKMDVTRQCINQILTLREILLSFQTGSNLVNVVVVSAILEICPGPEPSPVITDEGSMPEIPSRVAQTTAVLIRLKPVWIYKSISLSSKLRLMPSGT